MSTTTTVDEARERIAQKGREILDEGLTQRTSGNVSLRAGDDRIAISPSGVPYHEIEPEDVPIVDSGGDRIEGDLDPSSETPMHTEVYRRREDVGGIVHTHSPYATTFAALGETIPASHYLMAFAGTEVRTAEYGRNGTADLGQKAASTLGGDNAVLLRNHGVLAVGPTLEEAHNVAARVEYCARVHYQASQLGEPEIVDDEEMDDLIDYFQDYS